MFDSSAWKNLDKIKNQLNIKRNEENNNPKYQHSIKYTFLRETLFNIKSMDILKLDY